MRFGRNQKIAIWTGVSIAGATFLGAVLVGVFDRGGAALGQWISFAQVFVPGFLVPVLGWGALANRVTPTTPPVTP